MKIAVPGTRVAPPASASSTTSSVRRWPRSRMRATIARPRRHVVIWITRTRPTTTGNQPPSGIFGTLAAKNAMSTRKSGTVTASALRHGPPPAVDDHPVEQQRRDRHRRRDGDAVGGGEVARGAEPEHEPDAPDHQQPVDERYVDLTDLGGRRVADVEARQVVEAGSPAR